MSTLRLFTAVELPSDVRREIDARAMELLLRPAPGARQKQLSGLSMVPPENLHITVRFLGDVPQERVPQISEALRAAAASVPAGAARLLDFGAFPNQRRPSVVWCGVAGDESGRDTLGALEQAASAALTPLGLPPEQRASYHTHITVARVREARTRRVIAERLSAHRASTGDAATGNGATGDGATGNTAPGDAAAAAPSARIPVAHLTLFSSSARRPDGDAVAPRKKGVHYEVLARFPLGESGSAAG